MPKKIFPIFLLITMLLVSCGGSNVDSPPLVYLIQEGELMDGFQSSYCWDDGAGPALCVDSIEPYFDETIRIPANASIDLQLDSPLPDSLTLSLSREVFGDTLLSESVPVAELVSWSPAVDAGEYILTVGAKWPQGDVAYWFSILLE